MSVSARSVLIIDDSVSDRRIFRRYLEGMEGISLLEAPTGKAGLAACGAQRIDCILLDFRLPDLNGLELIRALRELTQAPIIFITGEPAALAQTQAYKLGVAKYLSKDFLGSEELRAAVSEALSGR